MRTLEQALFEHELITLRVIGEWWELDLTGADKASSARALAQALAGLDMQAELNFLAPEESAALQELVNSRGRMPVAAFSRQHGEVRMMGPGRLEREEPWFDPASPAEALWYRGFLYRGFDDTDEGVVEFYFLPKELLAGFPQPANESQRVQPELGPVEPPPTFQEATTEAVDDLTTMLCLAQREGLPEQESEQIGPYLQAVDPVRYELLLHLALELKLLRRTAEGLRPARPAVDWLQESRESQLRVLADAWRDSNWNELCHTPHLACEGSGWANDPVAARLALLAAIPQTGRWYPIEGVIEAVKTTDPDFQRPDGNYDTWYVRDLTTNTYITGFDNWELVEGRLLHFLLIGPMKWLGLVETNGGRFRLVARTLDWFSGKPPAGRGVQVPILVQPDAVLLVPHNANRYQRFQAARIAEPEPSEAGRPYRYRITPRSLAQANEQGITPERVLGFLAQASERSIPPSVNRAVERWATNGLEGRLQPTVILRVENSKILDTLQADPRTSPYLVERLGDLAVVVLQDRWHEFRDVTARLGLLLDLGE